MKLGFACLIALTAAADGVAADQSSIIKRSDQIIVVVTDSWTSTSGVAQWFQRGKHSEWKREGGPAPVVVGKTGLAWGRGELIVKNLAGPVKREGDNKAPAGVFRLGTAFGYSHKPIRTKMPYLALSTNVVAVDDPNSRYYNQLVDKTKVTRPDWQSAENMILADDRYKWGVVVMHNLPPVPGAGSCIFLHVWKDSSTLTTGCTAMAEENLLAMLQWLDPARKPLFVQLTRSIYNELQSKWGLPALEMESASSR
jgi:D-alanyl-D-alanine dipeptidase